MFASRTVITTPLLCLFFLRLSLFMLAPLLLPALSLLTLPFFVGIAVGIAIPLGITTSVGAFIMSSPLRSLCWTSLYQGRSLMSFSEGSSGGEAEVERERVGEGAATEKRSTHNKDLHIHCNIISCRMKQNKSKHRSTVDTVEFLPLPLHLITNVDIAGTIIERETYVLDVASEQVQTTGAFHENVPSPTPQNVQCRS